MDLVRRAQESGYLIGSCSDRPLSAQQAIWDRHEIRVDFIAAKHQLGVVKAKFDAAQYFHIGDRDLDRQAADQAGFGFWFVDEPRSKPWLLVTGGGYPD